MLLRHLDLKALIARPLARRRQQGQSTAWHRRAAYSHQPRVPGVSPTRFGDWEYNGRCTDFF